MTSQQSIFIYHTQTNSHPYTITRDQYNLKLTNLINLIVRETAKLYEVLDTGVGITLEQ